LGVLIEVDEKEIEKKFSDVDKIGNEIIDSINNTLKYGEDSQLGWSFLTAIPLDENGLNCGRCSNCGGWASDKEKPGFIRELGIGARINGKLFCDECLPPDHPLAF
jgi:hypothetical protein